ncbi:anti-sigma regulatory factor [Streptomyces sp. XY006]|uniref:anti-sigma regulatory factor n=1 Tax=Streptomyces sp. XY006 TaxID=2021410 RepID=UPI000B8BF5C1|nr:anti-sigma regulatory factor [Streptomyces sp. XY006]OXS32556.1 anti-sigma regulatory factor [Streptomyces sp. XY006]
MQTSADTATTRLPIGSDADLAWVRQKVRQTATDSGFSLVQQTKLITAASELARNTLIHGGGGQLDMTVLHGGLRLTFTDSGPGIRDIEQAMTDGFTTGNGLGMGLSGAKRLVQDFSIESQPGQGTTVTVTALATPMPHPRPEHG